VRPREAPGGRRRPGPLPFSVVEARPALLVLPPHCSQTTRMGSRHPGPTLDQGAREACVIVTPCATVGPDLMRRVRLLLPQAITRGLRDPL
jgi:hypothetical protein